MVTPQRNDDQSVRLAECWLIVPRGRCVLRSRRHSDCHEMALILHGELHTRSRRRVFIARPGDVLIYPRGVPHAPTSHGPGAFEMIALQWTGGDGFAQKRWTQPAKPTTTDSQG